MVPQILTSSPRQTKKLLNLCIALVKPRYPDPFPEEELDIEDDDYWWDCDKNLYLALIKMWMSDPDNEDITWDLVPEKKMIGILIICIFMMSGSALIDP